MEQTEIYYSVVQSIITADWQKEASSTNQLFVQIKPNAVHFLVFDYSNLNVLALESIQWTKKLEVEDQVAQIQHYIADKLWLASARFAVVYLSHFSEVFTAIPDPFFTSGSEADTLGMVAPLDTEKILVRTNRHVHRNFHLIFALPTVWEHWANQQFSGTTCQWLSEVSCFLEAGFSISKTSGERFLLALVDLNSVLFVGMNQGKLLFVNRFYYQSENDLLYFFLLAMESCELDPAEGRVILAGSVLPGSAGFEKLARYINRMEWAKSPSEIHFSEKLEMLTHHSWFDLLSLPLCINQLA